MHKVACYHCMHVTALLSVMVVGQDQTSVAHPMYYIRSHLTKSRVSDPLCFSQTIDWISRVWQGKKPLSLVGLWCNSNVLIAVVFTSYLVMCLFSWHLFNQSIRCLICNLIIHLSWFYFSLCCNKAKHWTVWDLVRG